MRRKITGLGWANRAVSGKKSPVIVDEHLVRIADDLVASIENACWLTYEKMPNLHGPTDHMRIAISAYLAWKRVSNV